MLCPSCRAGCAADDIFCRHCGADLAVPSKSLVATSQRNSTRLPAILQGAQLPRVAAGVGALAVGVGFELLRRSLLKRLARPALRSSSKMLPMVSPSTVRDLFMQPEKQPTKLPKGYEVQETVVYMSRVIRRED